MAITVGFLDEVGRNGRAPFCNWRARLAATMMNRLMLCSGSSGIEQWALFLGVVSDIVTNLTFQKSLESAECAPPYGHGAPVRPARWRPAILPTTASHC